MKLKFNKEISKAFSLFINRSLDFEKACEVSEACTQNYAWASPKTRPTFVSPCDKQLHDGIVPDFEIGLRLGLKLAEKPGSDIYWTTHCEAIFYFVGTPKEIISRFNFCQCPLKLLLDQGCQCGGG